MCEFRLNRDFYSSSLFIAMSVCDKFLTEDLHRCFVSQAFAQCVVEAVANECQIAVA